MKKKYLMLILTVAALILELLPYGAVLSFANPEGESFRRTFSYFSLTPFGYASFGPLLTALMTSALLVLSTVYCFKSTVKMLKIIKIVAFLGVIFSISPFFMGARYFSLTGVLISVCLLALCLTTSIKEE
ncbi:MAG: hypothetical protein E7597_04470 [Ruminococcaceae bacterium]|nr:hypothetical protein [Oscillospiraceae bacterium]